MKEVTVDEVVIGANSVIHGPPRNEGIALSFCGLVKAEQFRPGLTADITCGSCQRQLAALARKVAA